jgi:hypothetical protein
VCNVSSARAMNIPSLPRIISRTYRSPYSDYLGVGRPRNLDSIPGRDKSFFSLPQRPNSLLGPPRGYSPWSKAIAEVKNTCIYTCTPP